MVPMILFALFLLYGLWKIVATTGILRLHANDPDDKIVMLPNRSDPFNPLLLGTAGTIRAIARVRRRKWIVLTAYAGVVLLGPFRTLGEALIGLVVVYGAMMLLDFLISLFSGPRSVT